MFVCRSCALNTVRRRSPLRGRWTKEGFSFMSESSLPLQGVRVLERSGALAGRLTGRLLADQGAAVFALDRDDAAEENIDQYLNRGKNLVPAQVRAADENAAIFMG